jgi:type IV pilus assembly protein PilO
VLLLGGLLLGGVGYACYQYLYLPKAAEIALLEARLANLEMENRTARVITEQNGRDAVESQVAAYREQLLEVERLVPSSEELPDLLDAIAVEAQHAGIELSLIQPVAAVAEDYYVRRNYDLAVRGTYHGIGDFLTRVGSLPRIVTPINLNLAIRDEVTRSGDPRLEARFAIETYVLPTSYTFVNDTTVQ